jgi:hypothetical protein
MSWRALRHKALYVRDRIPVPDLFFNNALKYSNKLSHKRKLAGTGRFLCGLSEYLAGALDAGKNPGGEVEFASGKLPCQNPAG